MLDTVEGRETLSLTAEISDDREEMEVLRFSLISAHDAIMCFSSSFIRSRLEMRLAVIRETSVLSLQWIYTAFEFQVLPWMIPWAGWCKLSSRCRHSHLPLA